ncbi:MAG: hypothetical protein WKF92_05185 [Pyrinomonadaceae bacterium]
MAVCAVRTQNDLGPFYVLSPERYDPRRNAEELFGRNEGVNLLEIASVVRETVSAASAQKARYLILDTSHAREGIISSPKVSVGPKEIGSTKKILKENDVIISRLRPYLRQVAFVDGEIKGWSEDSLLVCSTEFFVLRSKNDNESIAFLVPFLLSGIVQRILTASQEGGHHPRVSESTLSTLLIPNGLLAVRHEVSVGVAAGISNYRSSEKMISELIEKSDSSFEFNLI